MPRSWAELIAYTRLRRLPVIRVTATGRTAEFNARKVRRLASPKDTPKERAAGIPFRLIIELQGRVCFLCGKQMHKATREHVVPRDLGGVNKRNVLAAHARCNVRKGNRMPHPCELLYCEVIYEMLDTPQGTGVAQT